MKLSKELAQQKVQQDYLAESFYITDSITDSQITVTELEEIAFNLSASLEQSRQLVSEQREELADKMEIIVKLEAELQSASKSDRQPLLQKLVDEKERVKLLETSLAGQRDNLHQQELAYQQYRELWQKRKQHIKRRWLIAIFSLLGVGIVVLFAFFFWLGFSRSSSTADNPLVIEKQIQQYKKLLRRDPNDFKTLQELTTLYIEQGELEAALPLMEKIVEQNPQAIEWQLNLATLYEVTANWQKAEQIYDQILLNNKNDFQSLLGKAYLRSQQGDFNTAKSLFEQAERVAITSELKAKVRKMAEQAQRKTDEK